MGQSASLYRIAKEDFSKVEANPEDFGLFKIKKAHETFEKTHEGLLFVIKKQQDQQATGLVEQIFYPESFVGEQLDYSDLDFDNLPDDVDLLEEPVHYDDPKVVKEISTLLNDISVEDFQISFDPNELNEQNVYPRGVWNTRTEPDYGYNVRDMTEEFVRLKQFYQDAADEGDYILSFVG